MFSHLNPREISHFQPDKTPGYHRASTVILFCMLVVQLITAFVVLADRRNGLEQNRIIVEDCLHDPTYKEPLIMEPPGKCGPMPIQLPIKV